MNFIVKGVDKTTGEERILKIEAADQQTAEAQASKRGVLVEAVRIGKSMQAPGAVLAPVTQPVDAEQEGDSESADALSLLSVTDDMVLREIRHSVRNSEKHLKEMRTQIWWIAFMLTVFFGLTLLGVGIGFISHMGR